MLYLRSGYPIVYTFTSVTRSAPGMPGDTGLLIYSATERGGVQEQQGCHHLPPTSLPWIAQHPPSAYSLDTTSTLLTAISSVDQEHPSSSGVLY